MLFEVQQAEQNYLENQTRFNRWILIYFILLPCLIGFSFAAAWVISASIYIPIKKLQDLDHHNHKKTTCKPWFQGKMWMNDHRTGAQF